MNSPASGHFKCGKQLPRRQGWLSTDVLESDTMKCPHCLTGFNEAWGITQLPQDKTTKAKSFAWRIRYLVCPTCDNLVAMLGQGTVTASNSYTETTRMVWPAAVTREPLSPDVPAAFASDYKEAVAVFHDSPKASAALSRRCLQHIIHDKAGIKEKNLDQEIQKLINSGKLPQDLSDAIDAVRTVGNFAAHPIKSVSSGEIVDVEDGEAEWLLDTIEGLFDFYFVRPAALQRKRDALNKKLADAGKPLLK